ncbi:MAG: PD-(D/E)XK nuclease family protein [Planctomycetes bacterium]|nr:PD-(D/E)XK nuclease family protein [Planctomycetota bacterium]
MAIEIMRVPLGADVSEYVASLLRDAARTAEPFAPAPVVYIAANERRSRSISRLAGELYPEGTPDRVARELLRLCAPKLRLRGEIERDFDFFGALSDTLAELGENRRAGRALVDELLGAWKRLAQTIPPHERAEKRLATWLPALGGRGVLFGGVVRRYIERLDELGCHDPEDALWLAAEHADVAPALLVVDDLDRITPARRAFISSLAGRAQRCLMILRGNRDTLRHIADAHDVSQQLMFETEGYVLKEGDWPRRPLADLCENWLEDVPGEAGLIVLRPSTRANEVREAARLIKLAHREGSRLGDICVAMPTTGAYRELIEEIFSESGVPFDAPFEIPLDEVAPVAALLDLVRAAIGGLGRNDVIDALASPFLPFGSEDPVAVRAALEAATRDAWVVGGDVQTNWLDRLNAKNPDGWAEIREHMVGVLDLLRPFARRRTRPVAFFAALESLLKASGAHDIARADMRARDSGAALRADALHAFTALLREMREEFARAGNSDLPVFDIMRALVEQARTRSVRPAEAGGERVRVLGLRELRGVSFGRLIVLGLTDRDLPLSEEQTMFLPPSGEEGLAAVLGKVAARELCSPIDVTAQADYLLAHALLAASGPATLMLPANEGDTPCVPATPLVRLLRCLGAGKLEDLPATQAGDVPTSQADVAARAAMLLAGMEREHAQPQAALALDSSALVAGVSGRCIELARTDMASPPGEYEGVIGPHGDLAVRYAVTGDARQTFSASQIDNYVECPQRFWSRYVVKARAHDEPTLDTKPSAVGTLLHATFERWVLLLREEAGQAAVLDDPVQRQPVSLLAIGEDADNARRIGRDLMARAFDYACRTNPAEGPFWEGVKKLVAAGLPGFADDGLGTGLLARFVEFELGRNAEGRAIRFAEFDFGRGDAPTEARPDTYADTLELLVPGGSLKLQGSVDRVDEGPDGLEIIDYKTGNTKTTAEVRDGKAFQLAAYLSAISQLAGTPPRGMAYLRVPPEGAIQEIDVTKRNNKPAFDVARLVFEQLPQRLARMLAAMRNGVFMHTPFAAPQKACKYCDYAAGCARRDDVIAERQARMASGELEVAHVYLPDTEEA